MDMSIMIASHITRYITMGLPVWFHVMNIVNMDVMQYLVIA